MSCSSGLNSITTAKSSAVLQRSSHSSLWRRLFWRQLPLTFCANRLEPSASILRSALPPKADMCGALAHVRFVPEADIHRTSCASVALASAFKLPMPWPPERRFQHPLFYAKLRGKASVTNAHLFDLNFFRCEKVLLAYTGYRVCEVEPSLFFQCQSAVCRDNQISSRSSLRWLPFASR